MVRGRGGGEAVYNLFFYVNIALKLNEQMILLEMHVFQNCYFPICRLFALRKNTKEWIEFLEGNPGFSVEGLQHLTQLNSQSQISAISRSMNILYIHTKATLNHFEQLFI